MTLVDAANDHHPHENLKIGDLPRVPGEKRLDGKRTIPLDNYVHPRRRNIYTRKDFDDIVYLHDEDRVVECRSLNDHRRVFRTGSCVQVAVTIGLFRANQHNVRRQVDEQTRVELDVGVNGADFEDTVFKQLRYPQALRACEGKIDLLRDPQLEQRELLRPRNASSGITSEDGRFEFTQLPAGKYALQGAKRGFIEAGYDQHEQFSTAIVTGAGLDTEHLMLRLSPFAVLSGKVFDEAGDPVRQAMVS